MRLEKQTKKTLAAMLSLALVPSSFAATVAWSGGDADPSNNLWDNDANWTTVTPVDNDALEFAQNAKLTSENNLTDLKVNSITFKTYDFTIDGNTIEVNHAGVLRAQSHSVINAPIVHTDAAAGSFISLYPAGTDVSLTLAGGLTTEGRVDVNNFENNVTNYVIFDGGVVDIGEYIAVRRGGVKFTGGVVATFGSGDSIQYSSDSNGTAVRNIVIDGEGTSVTTGRIRLNNWNTDPGDISITNGAVYTSTYGFVAGGGTHTITVDNGTMRGLASTEFLPSSAGITVDVLAGGLTVDSNGNSMSMSSVIAGVGGLTKIGANTLTLNATNTYAGDTTVEEGTLALAEAYLDDESTVELLDGAILNLSHTDTDVIGKLIYNGADLGAGIFNSDNTDFIIGDGALQVVAVPEPGSLALLGAGLLAFTRRRKQ